MIDLLEADGLHVPWRKLIFTFVSGMVFALSFLQSIMVTVAWWNGGLTAGAWEWMWIGLLPVWVFVYFRYYSVFRPGCRACLPPYDHASPHQDNPGE